MENILTSILIDYSKFTFKARQKYLSEEDFLHLRDKIKPSILTTIIHKEKPLFSIFAGIYLSDWIILHYTAGAPISTILKMMEAYYYITEDAFKRHGLNINDTSYQDLIKNEYMVSLPDEGPLQNLLAHPLNSLVSTNIFSIVGFTNYDLIKATYLQFFWLADERPGQKNAFDTDRYTEIFMRFFMNHFGIPDTPNPEEFIDADDPRIDLYHAMITNSPEECRQHLENYLQNWIKISIESSFYNGEELTKHLKDEPSFVGYWAFEVAIVAFIKKVDDSSFHKYFYYPKDIILYFKELHIENNLRSTNTYPIKGGEAATKAGLWFCKNMLENDPRRKIFKNTGEILPEGFSEKGEFWWEYFGND